MKAVFALLAVAAAIVGTAAAWDETNTLSYNFQKVINAQADEHPEWLIDATSGADFTQPNDPYGADASARVENTLIDLALTPATISGQTVDTHDVLTQYGSATTFEESPNLQKPCDNIYSASATAGENLALSGLYTDAIATLDNTATVSVADYTAETFPEAFGHVNAVEIEAEPAGDGGAVGGTVFPEANMGSAATVGLNELQAAGAFPTMSGSFTQWGSFSGAYNSLAPDGLPAEMDIDTAPLGAAEQQFNLFLTPIV